jgi:uncharacterized protein
VVLAFTRLTAAQATAQAAAQGVAPAGCDPARSLHVSSSAAINIVPNRVEIQIGIESNAPTAQGVQANNLRDSEAVIVAIKALGIDAKDIATDGFIISPVYDENGMLHIDGYRTNMVISVTLHDPAQTRDVLVAAFQAGANQVLDVEFTTTELRKYRDQARELALKSAREKADLLSETLGASTGCVIKISENSWSSYSGSWSSRSSFSSYQNFVQEAPPPAPENEDNEDADGPISLGQLAVCAEVSVDFALR